MMRIIKKTVIILLLGIFFALPVQAGFVKHILPCGYILEGDKEITECTFCHIWQLASNIINFISFNIAITIAPLLFVAAGIIYMTSGGVEAKLTLAKSIFINTIVGLVIIFCAWIAIDTVIKTVADDKEGIVVWSWSEFPECTGSFLKGEGDR